MRIISQCLAIGGVKKCGRGFVVLLILWSPLLRKKEVHNKIIGRGFPNKDVKNIVPDLNLDILGFVDDPYKIFISGKALISPLFTGGQVLKSKVIEALACGIPVIGTDIAFEGLPLLYLIPLCSLLRHKGLY